MRDRDHDAPDQAQPDDDRDQSGAWWRSPDATGDERDATGDERRPRTDGGTDAGGGTDTDDGADGVTLDPWGSATVGDYENLFREFGIEDFRAVIDDVPAPHYLMRRRVIFGHRNYGPVARALANDEPAAALSGFMPTGDPHVGHKLVFDELIWHQERGADTYGLIADLEAHAARGLSWDEIDEHARDYLLSLVALGFDPEAGELYRQSTNDRLQELAFELGGNARFSEFESIYGFDGETSVSHMQSVVTQMADILYPQLDEPKPTVIPVGPDQDPHVRLARDLAARMRYFKVTEAYASFAADTAELSLLDEAYAARETWADDPDRPRCTDAADWLADHDVAAELTGPRERVVEKLRNAGMEPLRPRVRLLDRNADPEAFDALIEAIDGEKRVFDAHVDTFELSRSEAADLAREVELDNGGYGFVAPSSLYHRFMTGLTGGKMSSSVPASHISLLDDPEDGYDKVKAATTGGRSTAEKQRELGGEPEECPVYELYAYLLSADDDEFAQRVYDECAGGERLCGGCKEQAAELMREFLEDHQEKREEAAELLADLDIDLDVGASRRGVASDAD